MKSIMSFLQGETECHVQQMVRMPKGNNNNTTVQGYMKAKKKFSLLQYVSAAKVI